MAKHIHIYLPAKTKDAGWNESQHKRDHGQFSSTGGSGSHEPSKAPPLRQGTSSVPPGPGKNGQAKLDAIKSHGKFASVQGSGDPSYHKSGFNHSPAMKHHGDAVAHHEDEAQKEYVKSGKSDLHVAHKKAAQAHALAGEEASQRAHGFGGEGYEGAATKAAAASGKVKAPDVTGVVGNPNFYKKPVVGAHRQQEIDRAQSEHAKRTGQALPRHQAALLVANKKK